MSVIMFNRVASLLEYVLARIKVADGHEALVAQLGLRLAVLELLHEEVLDELAVVARVADEDVVDHVVGRRDREAAVPQPRLRVAPDVERPLVVQVQDDLDRDSIRTLLARN